MADQAMATPGKEATAALGWAAPVTVAEVTEAPEKEAMAGLGWVATAQARETPGKEARKLDAPGAALNWRQAEAKGLL